MSDCIVTELPVGRVVVGADFSPHSRQYNFYLWGQDSAGLWGAHGVLIDHNVQWGEYRKPLLSLTDEQAQQLMDDLWRTGLRPQNGLGSDAQIEAMKQHLADMRAIVADRLEVKL